MSLTLQQPSPTRRSRSNERPLPPDDASTSIQCWFRQHMAKRHVDGMRVHLWWETRAASTLQRFWRCVVARRIVREMRVRLRGQRALEQRNRDDARLEALLIYIFWKGQPCHESAFIIQRSWKRRQKRRLFKSSGASSNATRHTSPGITSPGITSPVIVPQTNVAGRPPSAPLPNMGNAPQEISWTT